MLFFELFSWWYTRGWQQITEHAVRRLVRIAHVFSVPILLRTLGAPWRRIITYPGASLEAKYRALVDNLVSRCIGFVVRFLVLLTAAVILLLGAVIGLVSVVLWPLVPLLIIGFVLKGLGV